VIKRKGIPEKIWEIIKECSSKLAECMKTEHQPAILGTFMMCLNKGEDEILMPCWKSHSKTNFM